MFRNDTRNVHIDPSKKFPQLNTYNALNSPVFRQGKLNMYNALNSPVFRQGKDVRVSLKG